jgi:penicillin-binding protein 1C
MRLHRTILTLAAGLWLAAYGRDQFDALIDSTELPSLALDTSVEVLDRDDDLLRLYGGRRALADGGRSGGCRS